MEAGNHVILHRYDPKSKGKVSHDALVVGVEAAKEGQSPALHLAFVHPDRVAAISGANWRDALDRMISVPHEDDVENQAYFYEELFNVLQKYERALTTTTEEVTKLREQLASSTNPDNLSSADLEQLKDIADQTGLTAEGFALPSAADLDAVAADQKAAEETAGQTDQNNAQPE
jgi:regulator of replication initiation timing